MKPYIGKVKSIEAAISSLEGWAFGPDIKFHQYGVYNSLSIGEHKFQNISGVPGLREFADNLNDAIAPIVAAYAKQLRQEMANECLKVASAALDDSKDE